MENQKFFKCTHCGNFIAMIHNSGVPIICCGVPMEEQIANTVDASKEKHVPVVIVNNDSVQVKVGSEPHPMTNEHHIEFIYLQTNFGGHQCMLTNNKEAVANFKLSNGEQAKIAFSYCNLHGLWKKEI